MDILCISTTGWDEIWGSRQQIMLRLAKAGHRVLFVERQIGPEQYLKNPAYRKVRLNLTRSAPSINIMENLWHWQPPLMIPGRYYSPALNRFGQLRLVEQIKKIAGQLEFKSPILWMYPPHSAPLIGRFQERLSIYHCIERFVGEQVGHKRKVMTKLETTLLSNADLILVHSLGLQQLYEPLVSQPIEYVSSAADVEQIQSNGSIHFKMGAIKHPCLIVMGVFDSRIDVHLLEKIAKSHPDWHLVFVGRVKQPSTLLDSIHRLENVHVMGHHPHEELPAFLNGADVALIPYRINELTQYINPLKAYEYLAAGLPIVSTYLPELQPLSEWIQIVKSGGADVNEYHDRFIKAIETELSNSTAKRKAERRQFARTHSWDTRVAQILEIIWRHI